MGRIAARGQGKKLTEAAAFWARGGHSDEPDAIDDLVAWGVDRGQALEWVGEQPAEEYGIWPDNWQTVQLFLLLQTQWRIAAGMVANWIGLDYAAVHAAMLMLGIPRKDRGEVFSGLVVMERAALPLLNRKRD